MNRWLSYPDEDGFRISRWPLRLAEALDDWHKAYAVHGLDALQARWPANAVNEKALPKARLHKMGRGEFRKPPSGWNKGMRPVGSRCDAAIIESLKASRGKALRFREIRHFCGPLFGIKTFEACLRNLVKSGKLSVSGPKAHYRYKLSGEDDEKR